MRTTTWPKWFSFRNAAILLAALAVVAAMAVGLGSPANHGTAAAQVGTPTPATGICDRTQKVQDAILDLLPEVSACGDVTDSDLSGITGTLELSDMGVTSLNSGDFAGLSGLTELDLEDNEISTLPEGIFSGLTSLEVMTLTFTEVSALPEDLFDGLTNLRALYLDQNNLEQLPEDIFDGLTSLEVLSFGINKLSALPEDIFDGLTNLAILHLPINNVTALPEDVFDGLSNLELLNLHRKKIAALPAGVFDGLGELVFLVLSGNEITALPSGVFGDLGKLRTLLLDQNRIASLPQGAFEGLNSLATLGLSENPGAPFTVTAQLESRDDGVAVTVAEGAPMLMTVRLTATDSTLSHETVTVGGGMSDSGVITVTPSGSGDVTVSVSAPVFPASASYLYGISGSAGEDLTLAAADLSSSGNTVAAGATSISGTARVGETLTADTSGITDANGLVNVIYSYQWIRSSGGTDRPIRGGVGQTYEIRESDANKTIKVRVSFTDDAGYYESLTSAGTPAVEVGGSQQNVDPQNAPEDDAALTAGFQDNPEGHNGADAFTVRIAFSEEVDISAGDMRDHALTVSGATISSVGKVGDRSDLWEVTLQPDGDAEVALVIAPTTDCAADGAICTSDGRPLSDGLAVVIPKSEPVQNSPATGLPVISGTARAGETLTVSRSEISDEDGMTRASFGYWWFRVDGEEETLIEDDDGARYTLTDQDVGKTVWVRVKFTDDASNVETLDSEPTAAVEPRPLTAAFLNEPTSHDGQNAFTLEIRFSEEVELSYLTLRDHALTVTGGEVTGASRLDKPSNIRWQVTVEPDSEGGVTVVLPATTDCSAQGAVCTVGGKKLSAEVSVSVPGPAAQQQPQNSEATGAPTISGTVQVGQTLTASTSSIADADGLDNVSYSYQWMRGDGNTHTDIAGETGQTYELSGDDVGRTIKVRVSFTDNADNEESLTSAATGVVAPRPPLTASFQGKPSSHDGQADFTFELRFSEELPVSYLTLRDHAFTVTGGTVTGAHRLTQGSNIGWRITVTPDFDADVTVVLPVTTDCDASGSVCTGDGRKLSNRNEFTVSGL